MTISKEKMMDIGRGLMEEQVQWHEANGKMYNQGLLDAYRAGWSQGSLAMLGAVKTHGYNRGENT